MLPQRQIQHSRILKEIKALPDANIRKWNFKKWKNRSVEWPNSYSVGSAEWEKSAVESALLCSGSSLAACRDIVGCHFT